MQKKWAVKAVVDARVEAISTSLGVSRIAAQILAGRGIDTTEDAMQFLSPVLSAMPDPFLLKGMHLAVNRVLQAKNSGETVCIYGDYDCLLRN